MLRMTHTAKIDKFMVSTGLAEVYRVGGSVRDEILGRRVKDCDYVVRDADLKTIGSAVASTGAKITPLKLRDGRQAGWRANQRGLGLVEIMMPRTEVARDPRPDENKRHAFDIVTDPSLSLEEDAKRRDFTINALYRDIFTGQIVDPLGRGREDIEDRVLMTTHETSFRDDPLRILRALRFRSTLGFPLADECVRQMEDYAQEVTGLTAKGVSGTALDEFCKLLMGKHVAAAMRIMRDTGVMAVLFPELADMIGFEQESQYHDMPTCEHTFVALDNAANLRCSLRVRMGLVFHDSGKRKAAWRGDDGNLHYYENKEMGKEDHAVIGARNARAALTRLNAPKSLREDVVTIDERHMVPLSGSTKPAKVRRWRCELGDDLLEDLLKHRLCDVMAKGSVDYDAVQAIARLEKIREEAVRLKVPTKAKELPISGHDLIEMGLEGKDIGRVQQQLLHEVVSQPDRNDREWLLGRAAKLAGRV